MIGTEVSQYTLLERLGAGGMGEVFLAHDRRLDRKVALKLLSPDIRNDADARARFLREAKAAAAIDHP
jgi:serine/threonine-protein kinase